VRDKSQKEGWSRALYWEAGAAFVAWPLKRLDFFAYFFSNEKSKAFLAKKNMN